MFDANAAIEQLGGQGRLRAMIGAHDFLNGENTLQFGFAGSRRVNKVVLTYHPGADTYELMLGKCFRCGIRFDVAYRQDGLYAEDLIPTMERETGLRLSL